MANNRHNIQKAPFLFVQLDADIPVQWMRKQRSAPFTGCREGNGSDGIFIQRKVCFMHTVQRFTATFLYFYTFWPLTLALQSAKVLYKKTCCGNGSGKELIMAINNITDLNRKSVMRSSYFSYFKACFFAGLFCRTAKSNLSGS